MENNNTTNTSSSPAYGRETMEFVTVVVEYCTILEQVTDKSREEFTDTILKLTSLLYLKASLMPDFELMDDYQEEDFVTEENYNIIRGNIACIMEDKDDYLDVFVEDMKYSETPILCTISENLADIYQELRNFALRYRNSADELQAMNAIAICKDEFRYSWGQKLVNVMRALHEVRYSEVDEY